MIDGQGHRHRSRHDELLRLGDGGRRRRRHPEQRGLAHHPVDGRVRRGGRAARRADREAAGDHEPRVDRLRREAAHRPQARGRGGEAVRGARALPDRASGQRRRLGGGRRQGLLARRDLGDGAREDEADRGGLPRGAGHRGDRHVPRLLQRRPAPGHEGRGPHRRPVRAPHHQRAHRRGARLRHRQAEGGLHRARRGLRPRRRHVRHHDPRAQPRRVRGEGDERRHLPRRRGLRPAAHRLARAALPGAARDRSHARPDGAAAAQGGGGARQARALERDRDGGQPPVHHRRPDRPQAPRRDDRSRRRSRSCAAISSSGRSSRAAPRSRTPASPSSRSTR